MRDYLTFKFLQFRLKQIGRACKQAGWLATFSLGLFLLGMLLLLGFHMPSRSYLVLILYLMLTVPFHFRRNDDSFLRKLPCGKESIFGAEYNVIVLPVTLLLACRGHIGIAMAGQGLASVVAFIPSGQTATKPARWNPLILWIPEKLFEWRCFFRKHTLLWPACYLFAVLLSRYTFAVPLGLLILLLTIPEAYSHLEPKELIQRYPRNKQFLWAKLWDHSLFIQLLFGPLYLLFLLFHYQLWYLVLFFVVLVESSICFLLAYKYAQLDHRVSNTYNSLPFLIHLAMVMFFFPAALFYIYPYWNRATNAIRRYA